MEWSFDQFSQLHSFIFKKWTQRLVSACAIAVYILKFILLYSFVPNNILMYLPSYDQSHREEAWTSCGHDGINASWKWWSSILCEPLHNLSYPALFDTPISIKVDKFGPYPIAWSDTVRQDHV